VSGSSWCRQKRWVSQYATNRLRAVVVMNPMTKNTTNTAVFFFVFTFFRVENRLWGFVLCVGFCLRHPPLFSPSSAQFGLGDSRHSVPADSHHQIADFEQSFPLPFQLHRHTVSRESLFQCFAMATTPTTTTTTPTTTTTTTTTPAKPASLREELFSLCHTR